MYFKMDNLNMMGIFHDEVWKILRKQQILIKYSVSWTVVVGWTKYSIDLNQIFLNYIEK